MHRFDPRKYDYIFLPCFVDLLDGQIIRDKEASDHYPVTATIRLPQGQLRRFNTSRRRVTDPPNREEPDPQTVTTTVLQ